MTLTEKHNWLIMNGKRQVGYWLNGIFDEKLSKTVRDISKIEKTDETFREGIKEQYTKEENPIALTAVIQNPYCPNDIKMEIWKNHFEKIKDSWESIYSFEPNVELVFQGMKYIPSISDAQIRDVIENKLIVEKAPDIIDKIYDCCIELDDRTQKQIEKEKETEYYFPVL